MASVTGTVNTFGYLKDWIAVAYDTDTHAYANSAIVSSGTYNISGLTTGKLYNIVVKPKIGNVWTASIVTATNSYCVPTDLSGTPYVYEATTAGIPPVTNRMLLVTGHGSNNSTPSTLDYHGHTPTYVDNARIRTDQYKWSEYGSSLYFDGTGDHITFPDSADFEPAGSNFYFSSWVRFTGYGSAEGGGYHSTILSKDVAGDRGFYLEFYGTVSSWSGMIFSGFDSGGGRTDIIGTYAFAVNTWYFIEVSRSGNNIYLFVNGSLLNSGSTAFSRTIKNTTNSLKLGALKYDATNNYYLNGYVQDVEFFIGTAGHTSNYSVPTGPIALTTGSSEPTWPTTPSNTVTDNGVVWTNRGRNIRPRSFFQIAT